MLYGPGAVRRLPIVRRHVAAGGRVAMWDLGYWDREDGMRLSIDDLHPSAKMLGMAPEGPGRREFVLREDCDPTGPILLIGLGRKSCLAWGYAPLEWEGRKLSKLRAAFPARRILWRPKGREMVGLGGLDVSHGTSIEEALRGCSLVVCRHSNVAIDACVAGVPVDCEDGAALALYRDGASPSREARFEFLRRLTWWEWRSKEAAKAWKWIQTICG
jgi:hypothetical protein